MCAQDLKSMVEFVSKLSMTVFYRASNIQTCILLFLIALYIAIAIRILNKLANDINQHARRLVNDITHN